MTSVNGNEERSSGRRLPALAARALAVTLAVLLSGIAHDAAEILIGGGACSEPCEDDQGNEQCPPLCPDCTCVHGARPAVPPVARRADHGPASDDHVVASGGRQVPPEEPDLRGLFQPPRS